MHYIFVIFFFISLNCIIENVKIISELFESTTVFTDQAIMQPVEKYFPSF